jgi:limonene-1,2-epoxide hydrolase
VGIAELHEGRVIRYRDYFDRQMMAEQLQLD